MLLSGAFSSRSVSLHSPIEVRYFPVPCSSSCRLCSVVVQWAPVCVFTVRRLLTVLNNYNVTWKDLLKSLGRKSALIPCTSGRFMRQTMNHECKKIFQKWNLLEFVIITSQGRGRLYYFLESFHEKAGLWWAVLENHDVLLHNIKVCSLQCASLHGVFSLFEEAGKHGGEGATASLWESLMYIITHTHSLSPPPPHTSLLSILFICVFLAG